jgi:site-specific recombinase XerD
MDSFNINYYLQSENKKNKKCLILISVIWEGIRLRTTLNLAIESSNWDSDKKQVKRQSMDSLRINSKLDEIKFKLNDYYTKYKVENKKIPPKKDVQEIIKAILENREPRKKREKKPEKQLSFFEYFKEFIKDSEKGLRLTSAGKRIQSSTITSYKTTENHLENFLKTLKYEINFDNVDELFFSHITKYLANEKLSNNSTGRLIKVIKTFMHYTFQKGYHNNLRFVNALKVFDQDTTIVALTNDELIKLENIEAYLEEGEEFTPKNEKIRDLFLIQIYTGVRFSDLFNLKPANIDFNQKLITLNTIKTQENLSIPITSKLELLLKKYDCILPKISSQKYNEQIKIVCKLAKINTPVQITKFIGNKREISTEAKYELISSHTARRSFITLTLKKGIMPEMVMKVSGHKSRKSFQRYVRITQEEAIVQVQKAWEE